MGERKVLNKYIPADFDPKLVPRGSKPKDDLIPVRMMLPFTVQCSTCSDFAYRGRKFNSKKEPVKGSEGKYLGIQRYRFYIKCTACSRPMTFLTDPKNGDYEMESGGTRTYEVHKDKKKLIEKIEADDEKVEKQDPMKALENRVLASQKEMADLDNLDEIKAMNMRHLKLMSSMKNKDGSDTQMNMADLVLKKARHEKEEEVEKGGPIELDEEDEALIKTIKFGKQSVSSTNNSKRKDNDQSNVIRISEKEEKEAQFRRKMEQQLLEKQQAEMLNKSQITSKKLNPLIKVKRKRKVQAPESNKREKIETIKKQTKDIESGDALGLLGGYGSDSS